MEVVQRFCHRGLFLIWVFLPVGAKSFAGNDVGTVDPAVADAGDGTGLHVRRQLVGPGPGGGGEKYFAPTDVDTGRAPILIPDSLPASGQRKLEFGRMSLSHSRRASDSLQDGPSPSLSAWDGAHGVDGPS